MSPFSSTTRSEGSLVRLDLEEVLADDCFSEEGVGEALLLSTLLQMIDKGFKILEPSLEEEEGVFVNPGTVKLLMFVVQLPMECERIVLAEEERTNGDA